MDIDYCGKKYVLPDFLIIGAPRAGTTFLYQTLNNHPKIFMPFEKEPMFFYNWNKPMHLYYSPKPTRVSWITNKLDDYTNLFSKAKNQIIGEASTWYLSEYKTVIPNIKKLYGEKIDKLKIIVVLRNPVNRVWSHYVKKYSENREILPFKHAVSFEEMEKRRKNNFVPSYQYLRLSMYSEGVKAYLDSFKNIKYYIFENEFLNKEGYVKDVCDFLGIEFVPRIIEKKSVNSSGKPKNKLLGKLNNLLFHDSVLKKTVKMFIPESKRNKLKLTIKGKLHKPWHCPNDVKKDLFHYFEQDISKLEQILNIKLDIWKREITK